MKKFLFVIVAALVLAVIAFGMPLTAVSAAESTPILYENYTSKNNDDNFYGTYYKGQTFTASTSHSINKVSIALVRDGNPSGDVIVSIKNTDTSGNPVGSNLATGRIVASSVSASWSTYQWYDFNLDTNLNLTAGKKYAIIWRVPSSDSQNQLYYRMNTSGTYSGGQLVTSSNGTTWNLTSGKSWDAVFKLWGSSTATSTTSAATTAPTSTTTSTSTSSKFKIVGYASGSFVASSTSSTALSQTTHVILERLRVTSSTDVTLKMDGITASQITAAVTRAHAAGVKVFIELYSSYSNDGYLNVIFNSSTLRSKLVTNLKNFCVTYKLDGVDMDWESDCQSNLSISNYSQFYAELYSSLNPLGKKISMAAPTNKITITPSAASYFEMIHVMCYDLTNPWYGSYDAAVKAMNYWANAGIPKSKLLMGINFAGRYGPMNGWVSYKNIVANYNPSTSANQVSTSGGTLYYNGFNLVSQKAAWVAANGFGGCMAYHLGIDSYTSKSLLLAISDKLP